MPQMQQKQIIKEESKEQGLSTVIPGKCGDK